MFLVLSEIDCLNYLKRRGIHPDEFFTDFELFKNKCIVLSDLDVLVIFAGSCSFSKRRVCEFITSLRDREAGVNKVTVISDCTLPSINGYYKYTSFPEKMDMCDGWNTKKKGVVIWDDLQCPPRKTRKFLVKAKPYKVILSSDEQKQEDLLGVIKVPDFCVR